MDGAGDSPPSDLSYLTPGGAIDNLILHPIDTYEQARSGVANAQALASRSAGDYTLIGVGIILAIGALLISQKQTVVKVADTVAKAAA
jgi:hypothetical protein